MPEGWKTYRLGDIISIRGGFSYKGKYIGSGDSLLLGMGCVSHNDKFVHSGARPYSGECRDVFLQKPGDIVLATRQQSDNLPILGLPAIIPKEFVDKRVIGGTNLFLVNNTSEIDNRFLYWLLKSPDYKNHINSVSSGTTVRMITKSDVESYIFNCPSKKERQAISDLLWQIDDKIENNLAINKTLEEMAMALYKHWFIDFGPFQDGEFVESELGMIPRGWIVKKLNELGNIYYGKMPNKELISSKGFPVYSGYKIVGYYPTFNTKKGKVIVLARGVGGTGKVKRVFENLHLTNISICIENNNNLISDTLLYYTLKYKELFHLRTGSAQPQITINDLNSVNVIIPSDKVEKSFNQIISTYLDTIESKSTEIKILQNFNQCILPKLISGELRINDLNKDFANII